MKVALCLHGLFDSNTDKSSRGLDGYNHIRSKIIDQFDTDVYIHSWEPHKENQIKDLYKPVSSIFEEQRDFSNIVNARNLHTLVNAPRPAFSVLSHLYSVSRAMSLPYDNDINYDIVIKARFDLGRINRSTSGPHNPHNPYPVQCINMIRDIQHDKIYMADWQHFKMGPADMWFYGSMPVMKKFTTLYEDLLDNMHIGSKFHNWATTIQNNPGDLSNSIAFYKYWMMSNGLWLNRELMSTEWE